MSCGTVNYYSQSLSNETTDQYTKYRGKAHQS